MSRFRAEEAVAARHAEEAKAAVQEGLNQGLPSELLLALLWGEAETGSSLVELCSLR